MRAVRRFFFGMIILIACVGLGFIFVNFYPYIFSRTVKGVLVSIERIQLNVSLLQSSDEKVNPSLFSFALAIREDSGEIVAASAEDRQWAAAQKGNCIEAVFYPYPPWQVMKSGTYYNARLDKMSECPEKAKAVLPELEDASPAPTPSHNL